MDENTVHQMRRLISIGDYIIPNYTEACFLADVKYHRDSISKEEMRILIDRLRNNDSKSILVTSAFVENRKCTAGYDADHNEYFFLPFEEIPVRFPGTGDIFSAVFMGEILKGMTLKKSTQKAMNAVSKMIQINKDNVDKFEGIPIETCMEGIDE